ncbi:hypothetical protein Tco_1578601 [Tanacetum coccineum]
MSIATQRSIEDYKAQQNIAKVKEHVVDEELDQILEGAKNVDLDAFIDDVLNSQEDPATRIEPKNDKESPEAEKDADMVNVTNDDEEEESAGGEFELKRREKGNGIEETTDTPHPHPLDPPRTHIAPLSLDKETLQELTVLTEDAPSSTDKEKLKELTVTKPLHISPHKLQFLPFQTMQVFIHQTGSSLEVSQLPQLSTLYHSPKRSDDARTEGGNKSVRLGEEHRYHLEQMQNYLKSDIVWERRKEMSSQE